MTGRERHRVSKEQDALREARRERDEVRREGKEQAPLVRRLEKRARVNHFGELLQNVLHARKGT